MVPLVYLNSLLATLNARDAFRKQQTGASDHLSFPLSSVSGTHVNLHSYEQNKQVCQVWRFVL